MRGSIKQVTLSPEANLISANILQGISIAGVTGSLLLKCVAGTESVIGSSPATLYMTETTYTKAKEIQILCAGNITVAYSAAMASDSSSGLICLYKNGVTQQMDGIYDLSVIHHYSYSLSVSAGDLVQIYIKLASSGKTMSVYAMTITIASSNLATINL